MRPNSSQLASLLLTVASLMASEGRASTPPYPVELFAPGVISTRDYERDGAFSHDGKSFYFTKRTIWGYFSAICVSHWRDGHWSQPEVASFSGQFADLTPFVSADGSRLFFASRRPVNGVPSPVYNLWMVERVGDGWSTPRLLPEPINGHGSVLAPSETRDGSLYFIGGDSPHVLVSRRREGAWTTPVPAGDPNAPGSSEFAAFVDPNERYMIVSVIGRSDALNTAEGIYQHVDLYVRERRDDHWSPLRHLPAPINSGADESSPFVSPDGRWLYFMSERGVFTEHGTRYSAQGLERALHASGNGLGDIYRINFDATGIKP